MESDLWADAEDENKWDIWVYDEPEFLKDTEYKFNILTYTVNMALGTGGKNDDHAREGVDVLALWAVRKLFTACVKVAWRCGVAYVKRRFERRAR